jgi:hypothetical protein
MNLNPISFFISLCCPSANEDPSSPPPRTPRNTPEKVSQVSNILKEPEIKLDAPKLLDWPNIDFGD